MTRLTRVFEAFASRSRPRITEILRSRVNDGGDHLRAFLCTKSSRDLTVHEIKTEVEGSLWMFAPETFRYFLPAFLQASIESYSTLSVFVSELVGALTEPSRADFVEAIDRVVRTPPLGLTDDLSALLSNQQLEWFDSGDPLTTFHERVDPLTPAEGTAILDFFVTLQDAHGSDFPFGELEIAVDRHWRRYRASS